MRLCRASVRQRAKALLLNWVVVQKVRHLPSSHSKRRAPSASATFCSLNGTWIGFQIVMAGGCEAGLGARTNAN